MQTRWIVVYWAATVYIAATSAVAGTMDILRIEPMFGILLHLGYPAYFATLLGTWKVLGAVALLVPLVPQLVKEWAYAGMFITFTAAIVSHQAVGDGVVSLVGPILSIGFLAASWALRPSSPAGRTVRCS